MTISTERLTCLKPGDVIYECEYGANIEVRLTSAPEETGEGFEGRKQWRWTAENTQNGQVIDYLLTDGLEHYGPHLYDQPQYGYYRDGTFVTPLLGAKDNTHGA